MNTEERLKKAEDLLSRMAGHMTEFGYAMDLASEAKEMLQPDINFDVMPVGTDLLVDGNKGVKFSAIRDIFSIFCTNTKAVSISYSNEIISLPDHQLSHIHQIPWPSNGRRPDFIVNDEWIIVSDYQKDNYQEVKKADDINWKLMRSWYAILNITDYRKL